MTTSAVEVICETIGRCWAFPQAFLDLSVQEAGKALGKGYNPYTGWTSTSAHEEMRRVATGAFGCSQQPLTAIVRLVALAQKDLGLCHGCSSLGPEGPWDDGVGCMVSEDHLRCNLIL